MEQRNNIHPLRFQREDNFDKLEAYALDLFNYYSTSDIPFVRQIPSLFLVFGPDVASILIARAAEGLAPASLFLCNEIGTSLPKVVGMDEALSIVRGSTSEDSTFFIPLVFGSWSILGRHVIIESDKMHLLLSRTDMGDVPMSMIPVPYDNFYISLSQNESNFTLHNKITGKHKVDGVYICKVHPGEAIRRSIKINGEDFEISPPDNEIGQYGGYQIMISCLPNENSASDCDDHTQIITISNYPGRTPDQAIKHAFYAHLDQLSNMSAHFDHREQKIESIRELIDGKSDIEAMIGVVSHVVKILLYLSTGVLSSLKTYPEYDDMISKASRISGKKKDKFLRRAYRSLNSVVLSPSDQDQENFSKGTISWEMSPHYRKAHFRRVRIGKGRCSEKIAWIQATIVRKDLIGKRYNKDSDNDHRA